MRYPSKLYLSLALGRCPHDPVARRADVPLVGLHTRADVIARGGDAASGNIRRSRLCPLAYQFPRAGVCRPPTSTCRLVIARGEDAAPSRLPRPDKPHGPGEARQAPAVGLPTSRAVLSSRSRCRMQPIGLYIRRAIDPAPMVPGEASLSASHTRRLVIAHGLRLIRRADHIHNRPQSRPASRDSGHKSPCDVRPMGSATKRPVSASPTRRLVPARGEDATPIGAIRRALNAGPAREAL